MVATSGTSTQTVVVDEDGVEDLDAPGGWLGGSGGVPCPAAPAPRRGRYRATTVAALVAALVAVLGGGTAAHRTSAAAAAAAQEGAAALALQVSIPTGTVLGPASPGVDGWSRYSVAIPVVNLGAEPVAVAVLRLDAPHQRAVRSPAPVEVPAGGARTVLLVLEVRCDDVPVPGAAPVSRATAVLARVAAPDGDGHLDGGWRDGGVRDGVRVHLPWEHRGGDSFTQQLWSVCAARSA